jgi:hypothetical protein
MKVALVENFGADFVGARLRYSLFLKDNGASVTVIIPNGVIYFGELTFYNGSGYRGYIPDEFDFILGSKFDLPCNKGHLRTSK